MIYFWSDFVNGDSIDTFDPDADELHFDDPSISAASVSFTEGAPGTTIVEVNFTQVTVNLDFRSITQQNITFGDSSVLVVGDDSSFTGLDDGANDLAGMGSADQLIGLGGDDVLHVTIGGDRIDGGAGNDTIDFGQTGVIYGFPLQGVSVDLGNGTADVGDGAGATTTLISIETVVGTVGRDSLSGGDAAHAPDANGNAIAETFVPGSGNDVIIGAPGRGWVTVLDYSANTALQPVTANLGDNEAPGVISGNSVLDGLDPSNIDVIADIDEIRTGAGNDHLVGGGASRVFSGAFQEIFRPGAGDDVIDGIGNSPYDFLLNARVDYVTSTDTVRVNLDSVAHTLGGVLVDPATARDGTDAGGGGTDTLLNVRQVYGGSAADFFYGGSGNDSFNGGAGNDSIEGGAGSDEVRFTTAATLVFVNLGTTQVSPGDGGGGGGGPGGGGGGGGGGGPVVDPGTAWDGQGGIDTLSGIERVVGSAFNDFMYGSASDSEERFTGGAGTDTIDGGAGDGINYASYADSPQVAINAFIESGAGTVVDGFGTADTLTHIDGLIGGDANDTLAGGLGDQRFDGRYGNDTLDGGDGNDWAVYADDPSGVFVNLGPEAITVGSETVGPESGRDGWTGPNNFYAPVATTDVLVSIENVVGSAFNDVIYGSSGNNIFQGGDGADRLNGGAGNDALDGQAGDDLIIGGEGNDALIGGEGRNYLVGGAGEDTLVGGRNTPSTLQGGTENDTYVVFRADDSIVEFLVQGTDEVQTPLAAYTLRTHLENLTYTGTGTFYGKGNDVNNRIAGGAGKDLLSGLNGSDMLIGGGGPDYLVGGNGKDTLDATGSTGSQLQGGLGDDLYIVTSARDTLVEFAAQGVDEVQTTLASYTLRANLDNLTYTGSSPVFIGTGNALDNVITGGAGNDLLNGVFGTDTLNGLAGNDVLVFNGGTVNVDGGDGVDTLRFSSLGLSLDLTAPSVQFDNMDIVDLTGTGGNSLTLNVDDVFGPSQPGTLRIDGAGDDQVNAADAGSWTKSADATIGANLYHSYTQGGALLYVDTDINSNLPTF